ncbi:MAG: hypothetical protein ABWZ66_05010 [Pyrinomonadaceae bacterium]
MFSSEKIVKKSDSLIELLSAQCADLENLLSLARAETAAAEREDFEEILLIVTKRDEISQRLETFQRQIGELRGFLGAHEANQKQNAIAERIVETANLTLAQDGKTKLLLSAVRENAAKELQNMEKANRGANAYLRDTRKGLAYNRNF